MCARMDYREVICGLAVCALCKRQLAAPAFHRGRLSDQEPMSQPMERRTTVDIFLLSDHDLIIANRIMRVR